MVQARKMAAKSSIMFRFAQCLAQHVRIEGLEYTFHALHPQGHLKVKYIFKIILWPLVPQISWFIVLVQKR